MRARFLARLVRHSNPQPLNPKLEPQNPEFRTLNLKH